MHKAYSFCCVTETRYFYPQTQDRKLKNTKAIDYANGSVKLELEVCFVNQGQLWLSISSQSEKLPGQPTVICGPLQIILLAQWEVCVCVLLVWSSHDLCDLCECVWVYGSMCLPEYASHQAKCKQARGLSERSKWRLGDSNLWERKGVELHTEMESNCILPT